MVMSLTIGKGMLHGNSEAFFLLRCSDHFLDTKFIRRMFGKNKVFALLTKLIARFKVVA
jgi:hypothetical protein